MAEYKVVFEIQVDAESPLEAAKTVQNWMKEPGASWEFVVQMDGDNPIYLVAPEEEEGDAVLQIDNDYKPLIS